MTSICAPTLATLRASIPHDFLAFCTSYHLYCLLEKRPLPEEPDHIELCCFRHPRGVSIMVFLSPVDAVIEQTCRNSKGRRYEVYPFELVSPHPFIAEHDGVLSLALIYGFAALNDELLTEASGISLPLLHVMNFSPIPRIGEHFYLMLNQGFIDWLDGRLREAELSDYGVNNRKLSESPVSEIERLATLALKHPSRATESDCADLEQIAFFDVGEECWRFIPYTAPGAMQGMLVQ
jgi:hypothetical protein